MSLPFDAGQRQIMSILTTRVKTIRFDPWQAYRGHWTRPGLGRRTIFIPRGDPCGIFSFLWWYGKMLFSRTYPYIELYRKSRFWIPWMTSPQTIGLRADLGNKNESFGHVLFPVYAILHCMFTYFAMRLFLEILIHSSWRVHVFLPCRVQATPVRLKSLSSRL